MSFSAGIVLALSVALSGNASSTIAIQQPLPQAQTVEQYVQTYFADEPVMVSIAECESHFRQYSTDGSVYHGTIDPQDIGVMQINEHYQGTRAKALGIDIDTLQGNVAYAQYLYDKAGTVPWHSSEACWGPMQAASQNLADASN